MSEYAVHFTTGADENTDGYWPVMGILSTGNLNPSRPFGLAAEYDFLDETQKSVCLSEIPLDQLDRIVENRSQFGIGFKQAFLVANGGARVWYVDDPSSLADRWRSMVAAAKAESDPAAEIWQLTPFVDLASETAWFSQWEWEREWRVPRGLSFTPDDVAFLFIPAQLHEAARSFFDEVRNENRGPSYDCLLLDASWGEDQLQKAFEDLPV
ncbi:hypothetical protein G5V58_16560 [Nocardioides anomalus]|uniref:Uncharacterized protein n=1 Tax=Nocardioides anomalus TaxID=2712223 RepID=A0A6G6WG35_9ACTN|nr:hypothetical protein [Nocardioides anomalus]QIG44169.1 hypothetical protein G5V58_16560 [Nocardioides anomalus]